LAWGICIDQTTTQGLFNLTFGNIDNVAWVCIRGGGKLVALLLEIAMSEHTSKQGFFARWGQRITSFRNFVVNAGFLVLLVVVASAYSAALSGLKSTMAAPSSSHPWASW